MAACGVLPSVAERRGPGAWRGRLSPSDVPRPLGLPQLRLLPLLPLLRPDGPHGMRISEQSHVLESEMPTGPGPGGYSRFWLPSAIAKRRSGRWIYVPASVRRDLGAYAEDDRHLVIEEAREAGRYRKIRRPIVIPDPGDPHKAVHTLRTAGPVAGSTSGCWGRPSDGGCWPPPSTWLQSLAPT